MSLSPLELDELQALVTDHVGPANAIPSQELSEEMGGLDSLDSTPTTRAAVRDLVTRRGVPVGANGDGYYVITEADDLLNYVERLDQRIAGIRERRQAVIDAYLDEGEELTGTQQTLPGVASDGGES